MTSPKVGIILFFSISLFIAELVGFATKYWLLNPGGFALGIWVQDGSGSEIICGASDSSSFCQKINAVRAMVIIGLLLQLISMFFLCCSTTHKKRAYQVLTIIALVSIILGEIVWGAGVAGDSTIKTAGYKTTGWSIIVLVIASLLTLVPFGISFSLGNSTA